MTHHRAINWLLASLIAGGTSTAYLLDDFSDPQDLRAASAASLADAKAQAKRTARFERAARKACGSDDGAYALLDDGAIQCLTHQGRKTVIAKMAL